jgi:hypothetical protein
MNCFFSYKYLAKRISEYSYFAACLSKKNNNRTIVFYVKPASVIVFKNTITINFKQYEVLF